MINQTRDNTTEQETVPARQELASATDVIHSLVRTSKGLRIYLANNPVLVRFVEELTSKMALHMAQYGDLRLEVERFSLRCLDVDVYRNNDPNESIAFRLYADGIRTLIFRQGVKAEELIDFLGIVGFEGGVRQDDDIVTRLWEKSLPHIDYLLEEEFVEVGWARALEDSPSQQDSISRICAFIGQNSPLPPRVISKHLLMLTGDEGKRLRQAMQAEELRNPLDDVINILSAILAGGQKPALFQEFSEIMAKLASDMFLLGDMGQALQLVRFLDKLSRHAGLPPEQQRRLRDLLAGVFSERTVQALQQAIDSSEAVSHEELRELLQIFGVACLGQTCELLGRVEKLKMRKVIIEVMVELGKENPAVFLPFLSDPRWYLVRNMVLVLSLVGSPAALEMIAGLISHKEMRIRKEVLGFLERATDRKSKAYILRFLRDESSALRMKALQVLARERQQFALKSVIALTAAEEFRSRELAEKKAVYETIGELGGGASLPIFREMLVKKSWFKKAADRETALCVVAGLLKVRGAAAVELLEEARNQQSMEVRAILERAIDALGAPGGKAAGSREGR